MMGNLPALHFTEPPAWQRERLYAWLQEWELDQRLRAALAEDLQETAVLPAAGMPSAAATSGARPFDAPVAYGQIRLLSSRLVPEADRPVYVVTFACWQNDWLLFAPFSRFATPATPGEWLTGRDVPALRVLSLWNTRSVPPAALAQSWLVGEWTEVECDAAWAIFEHVTIGEPLPEHLREKVGPPVRHPRDPRLRYQEEEMALFGQTTAALKELVPVPAAEPDHVTPADLEEVEAFLSTIPFLREWEAQRKRLPLAAATEQTASYRALFFAPEQNVLILVVPTGADLGFAVYDPQGAPSNALDGARLLAADGAEVAVVRSTQAVAPGTALRVGFRLVSPEGRSIRLEPRSEGEGD